MPTDTHTILADTEVFQQDHGYERILLVAHWHPTNPGNLAQIHIRVDKNPGASFAKGSIWASAAGWQLMAMLPAQSFWKDMPGYLRWHNDNSATKTMQVADRLVNELVVMADEGLI
jgi:hypothetical protein